jgi:hypothetical protein
MNLINKSKKIYCERRATKTVVVLDDRLLLIDTAHLTQKNNIRLDNKR